MMKKLIFALLTTLLLTACGGDKTLSGSGSTSSSSSSSSSNSSATAAVTSVTVVSSSSTMPSDGSAGATITAYVRDANNNLLDGVTVSFVATSGGITSSASTSDGAAAASLITAGDSTLRTIQVTATAGGVSNSVSVQVVSASSSTTVQMGSGTGTGFQAGVINTGITGTLSAGGTTSLTVSLVQSDGNLYTGSTSITFNSPCIADGSAAVQPSSTVTTTTGSASVTYVAQGCTPSDIITAQATVGSSSLSATGTISISSPTIGSLVFVSATPSSIALKGTGSSSMPETSRVRFQVLDSTNSPLRSATVNFSLNSSVGGVALSETTDTSDSNGYVEAIVNSGTVATAVRVTATVASTSISTQSSVLTVTTGIATDSSFSVAVGCFNIEGWDNDGVTTSVTARLGDRFQNPVPDGTAVTFTAEGGNITSQCSTATTSTEGGVCSVNYSSSNPRPSDGRVTLLAKAIGEESFTDTNGDGKFLTGTDTFSDLAEPYRDDNENAAYDAGEDFFDFNVNGTRDLADGMFNGVLCTGASCSATAQSSGIGEQAKIILSGSTPFITVFNASNTNVTGNTLPVGSTNGALPIRFLILDLHGNVMPGGTTVSLSASGASLAVASPSSFTVPCSAVAANSVVSGATSFPFTVTSGTTTGTGVVTLTVTTPLGVSTIHQISVTNP